MAQLFSPGADAIYRLSLLTALACLAGVPVIAAAIMRSDYVTGVGIAPSQPAPFSHKHHSGELGIDCRYCHTAVETQATAGIPPTHTCMTCHSQIWAGSDMLKPVRDSYGRNEPLEWVRLNRLPQYVYYNHSVHVTKGIGCSTCHGDVTAMQMTYRANAFEMRFCLDCHRNPEKYVRAQDQVWNMNWTPPPDQATLGPKLVAQNHIRGGERLAECSVCHR
ncbi:cytochrome c3 family protein [Methylobacterium planeticum]|uniref:Cytochrome c3 family protein n=1 Tax=Methylobacterium planeticum TaxID=2615211 RepID=A0A6N6MTV5_9HYPH|nr:cytochrome c3 family protein [Methylobacterium planeticum]KAB1073945.1 cytochrome c3 family protein [Methylobacterium planeticum]